MKYSFIIGLLLAVFTSFAYADNADEQGILDKKISLNAKNELLKDVLHQITETNGVNIIFTVNEIFNTKKVSISANAQPLKSVLNLLLSPYALTYIVENTKIVIKHTIVQKPAATKILDTTVSDSLQKRVLYGTIIDSLTGNSIPAVSVKVKGKSLGVISTSDGVFRLEGSFNDNDVITFSCIGYAPLNIVVNDIHSPAIIKLQPNNKALNDVVVTGFGESREKRSLGYSITQVSGDDIRRSNASDPITALEGMVTGLQVNPGIAGPGATARFLIRGSSSLDPYNNTPLIVVDNVIMDNSTVTPLQDGQTDYGNILKDINMDDIESISVLKGGAVTALYGSRANNGVILIKTKKGLSQKGLGISVSEGIELDQAYKMVDFQNEYGVGLSASQSQAPDIITTSDGQKQMNPNTFAGVNFGPKMDGNTILDPYGHVQKNSPDNILDLYRTGVINNTNVSVSGADDKGSFRFSWSNYSGHSINPNNSINRNSFDLRGVRRFMDNRFTVDGSVSYVRTQVMNPALQGSSSVIYSMAYGGIRNYDLDYWKNNYIDTSAGGVNNNDPTKTTQTLFGLYQNKYWQNENTIIGSIDAQAQLTSWLTFHGIASVNVYDIDNTSNTRGQQPGFYGNNYSYGINNTYTTRYRADLTAQKTRGDFYGLVQAGFELTKDHSTGTSYYTTGMIYPDIFRISNAAQQNIHITESKPNIRDVNAIYGQASLEWKRALTLNLYARNDWNSTLVYNDGHGKYGYFYGGADVAWVFSDMLHLPQNIIDYGKLRLSYATTGNGTSAYTTNTGSYSLGSYTNASGSPITTTYYGSSSLPNQNLTPERSGKLEAGLEFKMLHSRLGGDFTFYSQDTKNQIINFPVNQAAGVTAALLNGGKIRNQGLELTLYGTPIETRNFSWNSRVNYTRNRNKVLSIPFGIPYVQLTGGDGIETLAKAGGGYADMYASYAYARYQATDDNGNKTASSLNGLPVLQVYSGGSLIGFQRATNYGTDDDSRTPKIGSTLPDFLGSWINTFNYKGFSLNIFLDSKIGGMEYSSTYNYGSETGVIKSSLKGRDAQHGGVAYTPVAGQTDIYGLPLDNKQQYGVVYNGVFASGAKTLGPDGQQHDVSNMTYKDAVAKGLAQPMDPVTAYEFQYGWGYGIREAGTFTSSWVAVREISIGYDLPKKFANKIRFNGLQFILSGRNLFYLYNSAPDHINPDNLSSTSSSDAFERGGVPYTRSFSATIRASF